jgi:general secretion pathway protein C
MDLAQSKKRSSWSAALLPAAAAGALTVLIAFELAGLTWQILRPAPPARADTVVQRSVPTSAPEQRPNYAWQIANLHMFGEAQAPAPTQVLDAPETRLNLTLRGVYATGDDQALAIISSGGRDEKFYHLGDAISGGGTLKAVYDDRVILEHNLQMETLRLPKGEEIDLGAGSGDVSTMPVALGRETVGYTSTYDRGLASGQSTQLDLGALREKILQNPGRLGDMLQAAPVNENGKFKGYRLTPQGSANLFGKLGLRSGDIVTAVNGIAIDRPDKGLLALQDLVKADRVTVTLLRNGSEITVEHNLGN